MKVGLLDVNVLLALAWPNHQQHHEARGWFQSEGNSGWATCALTQLGFIRLSSNPAFTPAAVSPMEAAELLSRWTQHPGHHFFASPRADQSSIFARSFGHQQVNDAWLVRTAAQNGGRLVTFDAGVAGHAVDKGLVCVIGM